MHAQTVTESGRIMSLQREIMRATGNWIKVNEDWFELHILFCLTHISIIYQGFYYHTNLV